MAKSLYIKELQKVMQDKTPVAPNGMAELEIHAAIETISEQLRGPLHNAERLCLVEDRAKLRRMLPSPTITQPGE